MTAGWNGQSSLLYRSVEVCGVLTRSGLCRDEWRRLKRRIVAIDALHFRDPKQQFHMNAIERELNKVRLWLRAGTVHVCRT